MSRYLFKLAYFRSTIIGQLLFKVWEPVLLIRTTFRPHVIFFNVPLPLVEGIYSFFQKIRDVITWLFHPPLSLSPSPPPPLPFFNSAYFLGLIYTRSAGLANKRNSGENWRQYSLHSVQKDSLRQSLTLITAIRFGEYRAAFAKSCHLVSAPWQTFQLRLWDNNLQTDFSFSVTMWWSAF